MNKKQKTNFFHPTFSFLLFLFFLLSPFPATAKSAKTPISKLTPLDQILFSPSKISKEFVKITRVIDGDTVVLEKGKHVRLIGIDTPERNEPLYKEATNYLKTLILKGKSFLSYDKTKKDRYGRTLAFLFIELKNKKLLFVNAQMVITGFARVYPYPPNLKYWKKFTKLQKIARQCGVGVWGLPKRSSDAEYVGSHYRVHRISCRNARRIRRNRHIFSNMEEALDKGLSPARCCKP